MMAGDPKTFQQIKTERDLANAEDGDVLVAERVANQTGAVTIQATGAGKFVKEDTPHLMLDSINDTNDKEALLIEAILNAVNYLGIKNSATGNAVELTANGTDANINIKFTPKGSGANDINNALFSALNKPSDYWSASFKPMFSAAGYIGTNSSFNFGIFYNGYQNTSSQWTSLGINGSSVAGGIEFEYSTGAILFRATTSHTTGSAASPPAVARIGPTGDFTIGTINLLVPVGQGGALGTPSSGTLTNCTGLPIAGISGLGTGVATLLAGTSTGTGGLVGKTSPTFTTPILGDATATTINKVTFTSPATGSTLTVADGKTLICSNTLNLQATDGSIIALGAGGTVLYNGGALGTPSSGTLTNCIVHNKFILVQRGSSDTGTLTAATDTKVQFNTEISDTQNWFDNSTNYRFQPSRSGVYLVCGSVKLKSPGSGSLNIVNIYKNGSLYQEAGRLVLGGAGNATVAYSTCVSLNGSTDYIEIYTTTSASGVVIDGTTSGTFLSAVYVGAA